MDNPEIQNEDKKNTKNPTTQKIDEEHGPPP